MSPPQVKRSTAVPFGISLTGVACLLMWTACAYAQGTVGPQTGPPGDVYLGATSVAHAGPWQGTTPVRIREGLRADAGSRILHPLSAAGASTALEALSLGLNSQQPRRPGRQRSIQRKVLGGIVGGVGGFFGGLFLGAAIEGDRCDCDDPGLIGALIGAPVGGAAGGLLGYKFLF